MVKIFTFLSVCPWLGNTDLIIFFLKTQNLKKGMQKAGIIGMCPIEFTFYQVNL